MKVAKVPTQIQVNLCYHIVSLHLLQELNALSLFKIINYDLSLSELI